MATGELNDILNLNSNGKDIIKGGIFFGGNLTPMGVFSNIPQFAVTNPLLNTIPSLSLTLQKVKDSLSDTIQQQTGANSTNNLTIEKYLYDFINLLIDYRDIRNFVFYGSANTELAYNINFLINNYPYNTLVAKPYNLSGIIDFTINSNNSSYTDITFPEIYPTSLTNFIRIIRDNFNRFNFFDDDPNINWNNYEIIDKNNKRYSIKNVITPYENYSNPPVPPTSIFNVLNIIQITAGVLIPYQTLQIQTDNPHNYSIGQHVSFLNLQNTLGNNFQYKIGIYNSLTLSYDYYFYPMNNNEFIIDSTNTPYTFTIRRLNAVPFENMFIDITYDTINFGKVRKYPLNTNDHPFELKITIEGKMSEIDMIDYFEGSDSYKGFLISPLISIVNDFNSNLTPIQNMLLSPSPVNPTPWPRRIITNNIMNIIDGNDAENLFNLWINDPKSLYVSQLSDDTDVDAAWSNWGLNYEYNLIRALALDETETNQLVRRCIPADIINEKFDTENSYFQRFILIAGWLFDNIRQYSKFVKFAHTINTTQYNQLSPEYYKYLASNWGLELFKDDSIDFSKLVIQTVPGEYFGLSQTQINNNSYYQQTIQQLQNTKEKYLLYSLIHLYKEKGTQSSINKLINLLGAPDNFLQLNEFSFNVNNQNNKGYPINGYKGTRIIDNEKVYVPDISFEIDPDYLLDKTNINNSINKPYFYRKKLNNEYNHNLRELSLLTDPNGAIESQIINNFGNQLYNYITFEKGEFTNLQKIKTSSSNVNFWLLPLSIPDRYFGMSIDYMIPKNGINKGYGSNQEEVTFNLFSLYRINNLLDYPLSNLINTIHNIITISTTSTETIIQIISTSHITYNSGDQIFIYDVIGINNLNNLTFTVIDTQVVPIIGYPGIGINAFTISGNFNYSGIGYVIDSGFSTLGTVSEITSTVVGDLKYTYPVAIQYQQRNIIADNSLAYDSHSNHITDGWTNPDSDFNILQRRYPSSYYNEDTYIITRLEGKDLVIRLRIDPEPPHMPSPLPAVERCAILENVFFPDGLNHSLRVIFKEDGVEVYKDYIYIGFAKWLNTVSAGSYHPYEIPKSEIKSLNIPCSIAYESINIHQYIAMPELYHFDTDKLHWWDLFIGMPDGIKMYVKKINIFENNTINSYNIGDRIINTNSIDDTAENYIFEVANPTLNSILTEEIQDFNIPAIFYEMSPNLFPIYYGYKLPTTQDQYSRNIIQNLTLTNKRCLSEINNSLSLNKIQDFFNFVDIFSNNAWDKNIHKNYDYSLFSQELIHLYELYSSTVLTYSELEPFMELVEQKFKSTFSNFVPLVINIFEFGRIIRNNMFEQTKMRLPGANKICTAHYLQTPAILTTSIFRELFLTEQPGIVGMYENNGFSCQLNLHYGSTIINYFTITCSWMGNYYNTLVQLKTLIQGLTITALPGLSSHLHVDVYSMQIRIWVDYDWFVTASGHSPNQLQLITHQDATIGTVITPIPLAVTDTYNFLNGMPTDLTDIQPAYSDGCGYTIDYGYSDTDICGSVSYSLPDATIHPTYIYYTPELRAPRFIHFSTEFSDPVFIHYPLNTLGIEVILP